MRRYVRLLAATLAGIAGVATLVWGAANYATLGNVTYFWLSVLPAATAVTAGEHAGDDAGGDVGGDVYGEFPGMDVVYDGPLPWDNEPAFQQAVVKYQVPVRLAAYRATLKDPLPGEGENIALAARKLAGTVVSPGKVFSQNAALGPYTRDKGYRPGPTYQGDQFITTVGGGVCKIASLLYNLATLSDMEVVMRYPHSMTVPYVPPGQDATVYYGVKDFRFRNNTDMPLLLWAQRVDNTVYMAVYGRRPAPQVTWHHQVLKRFKYGTVYRYNAKLARGEEREVMPGQEGLIVKSWVSVTMPDGQVVTRKKGVSFYSPAPRVVERGRR